MSTVLLAQILANGLVMGAIYAMVALGLALIFGVLDIVNFAHGEFYMAGAMLTWFFTDQFGLGYLRAIPLALAAVAAMSLLTYALVKNTAGATERAIILTLSLAMILQNGAMLLWSATPRDVSFPAASGMLDFGLFSMPVNRGLAFVVALLCICGLFFMLHKTQLGRTIRATAQNRRAAMMVGIKPQAAIRMAVLIGVGLAALAGILLAPIYSVHPMMGQAFLIKVFAIVIIGGMGSLLGAVVVAFGMGLFENVMALFVSMAVVDLMLFALMIGVLLVRPQGLFGRLARL
ncbi:branched-chain amino acid ABC transporter permease [Variovorax sp. M-6]|uniref:branched-chain amino acid ABC transporter permease n=1 Tax=Variovorax sp. M-6 TaxID=3233041 RepID=UPI003F9CB9C8